ncbi:CBASS cGAMP-activated phospholipase [Myroides sp. N17-2]|uniref:CBASS cGAMP-activated phospholipase n=1 Tax=Myroides sp. N17-2 TaxID=2030799 RepID=UPI000EFD11D2|nr:CBASS cGAMP-activated phospholipase [Myroides sp. N17-2]
MKTFKILSIDGGGIKGLYSARILEKFEQKFKCKTSDHFDMICGTSTGGLIALALTSLITAENICKFYEDKGEIIFPSSKEFKIPFLGKTSKRGIKQILWKGKFENEGLKKSLDEIFGDKIIGNANNLLCIPSYSVTEAKPKVFKYDHKEGNLSRDNRAKMVDIALATSAAPTYFPMAELPYYNNEQFIDGGVWANNPTLVGLLEALNNFVGKDKEYKNIKILSLSSLSITGGNATGLKNERSFKDWGANLFETSMNGQSFFTDFFLSKVKEISDIDIEYTRIPSAAISKEQESIVQLDVANKEAYNLMKIKADDQALIYEKTPEIKYFFTTPKTYITNG